MIMIFVYYSYRLHFCSEKPVQTRHVRITPAIPVSVL
jgi:hypothetical protein